MSTYEQIPPFSPGFCPHPHIDNRECEFTKRVFSFRNDIEGFNSFNLWAETLMNENKKTAVLIGYELTDHYWFAFAKYVNDHLPPLFVRTPGSFLLVSHISPDNHQMNDE